MERHVVQWGFQWPPSLLLFCDSKLMKASMQLRSWDKVVQMRPDKPETLCPVFLPNSPWWVTCILVNPLLLLSIVFPSPGSEVQTPTYSQAGSGSLFCPAALKKKS